ncbi:hypothetical protein M6D93_04130 [Jatrophihabitans telluris]|uniref:Uncharacterized protein n=1 Tax=Jatrophihabitans telluris TaxID=2038343 RepID=A0ABY4R142_9ACTN|nr:hypothetical protein [Jatrophihabitans telluris]UQX89197.1 hypothetical protein M6D93_04130 [Jatrophihabitans telluris]
MAVDVGALLLLPDKTGAVVAVICTTGLVVAYVVLFLWAPATFIRWSVRLWSWGENDNPNRW